MDEGERKVKQEADQWTAEKIAQLQCEDRGAGLKPRHVYLDGSGKCVCGQGSILTERRR